MTPNPPLHPPIDPASWQRVLVVMERLAASSDLTEVLNLIIDSLRDCLAADRATVFEYDAATKELCVRQAHGLNAMRFSVSGPGIAAEAARTGASINLPDAYADPRFNQSVDKATGYRTRNMLTIPLMSFDGVLEGVAQVLNKDAARGAHFDGNDEMIARALASQAAVAMRRARLIEAEKRKTKIEGDLALARSIQQSAFPQSVPQIAGYSVAATSIPAEETGGDTFDVLDWGELCPGRSGLLFVLADATGHGIGPALSVAQFRGMVRMGARIGLPLKDVAWHLNQQMTTDLPPGRFVTALWGHLDASTNLLTYESAGQAPILVVRANGEVVDLPANSLPVGITTDFLPEPVAPITLQPGDTFLLLSDGYYEAPIDIDNSGVSDAPTNDQFGTERVARIVTSNPHADAQTLLDLLNSAVEAYSGRGIKGKSLPDDRTAIVIRRSHEPR